MGETPGGPLNRTYRGLLPGNMGGVVHTDLSLNVNKLGRGFGYLPSAYSAGAGRATPASDHRVISFGGGAERTVAAHTYLEDLADLAREVFTDIRIGMATNGPTGRPYNQRELPPACAV